MQNGSAATLELDLEHYVVPAPSTSANSGLVYAANMTETPRSLTRAGVFSHADGSSSVSSSFKDGGGVSVDRPATIKVYFGNSCVKFTNRFFFCFMLWIQNGSYYKSMSWGHVLYYLFNRFLCLDEI